MKSRYVQGAFVVLATILTIISGVILADAQGKGRGGGGGNRGGGAPPQSPVRTAPPPQQRQQAQPRFERPQAQRAAPQPRFERPQVQRAAPQPRFERPQVQRQAQQPRFERPQIQRQAPQPRFERQARQPQMQPRIERQQIPRQIQRINPGWQNRGGQQQNARQPRVERVSPQIVGRPDLRQFGQPRQGVARQTDPRQGRPGVSPGAGFPVNPQRQARIERAQTSIDPRQAIQTARQINRRLGGSQTALNNLRTDNLASPAVRQSNARLAAQTALSTWANPTRSDIREARWFAANQYAGQPQYRQNRGAFEDRELWRESFLRSLAVSAMVSNSGYYGGVSAYPTYSSYYYGVPLDPAYDTAGYGYDYPYSYVTPAYYTGPAFEFGFTSGYGANVLYSDVYEDDFPYVDFADPYAADIYIRQDFGQLVAYGYEQGYYDGLAARDAGYDIEYFDDPYAYNSTIYDPYSYSLGQNRRCLGKGYQLGYVDAIYGREEYDPVYYGDVNLVSAFVSDVSVVSVSF